MTSVNIEIGGVDYGDCAIQVDLHRDATNLIGTWEVLFDTIGNCAWPIPHSFAVDTTVEIIIDGVTMMWGYIDDILPQLDTRGYHTILCKMTGRDRGMDLAQHYVTAEYFNVNAQSILGNAAGSLLRLIPSEITRVTVGAPPGNISYEADRTYLSDAVREVLDLAGYEGYIDNTGPGAGNAQLRIFAPGSFASPITLRDFAGSNLNNILHIEPVGEATGFDVKNYVEGHCGSLEDHYTDMNAADWTPTNCAVTNDTVIYLNGRGAIRATQNTGAPAQPTIALNFGLAGVQATYSYASLDLSEPCMGSYNYFMVDTSSVTPRLEMTLTDNLGNSIIWSRTTFGGLAAGDRNNSEYPAAFGTQWRKVDFQLGFEAGIEAVRTPTTKGTWGYMAVVAPPFNWAAVTMIDFSTSLLNLNNNDFFVIDGLTFPNLEVHSVQQDAPSIGLYGQRMKDFYQPSIKNQYDLNAYTVRKLVELKDPKETMWCRTIGQTGTPFPAETVEVVAPDFGIGGPLIGNTVTYRIVKLHHKVIKNSAESEATGWNYTTEYELVRHQYYGTATTQYIEGSRIGKTVNPVDSILRETRLSEQYRRRGPNVRLSP